MKNNAFNIKGEVLFVQEINEKVQKLMDSLLANLSQNLDLVERDFPKNRKAEHIYENLLQRKKESTHTPKRFRSHAEMTRQYYRARISLIDMEKPMAFVASTVLCKAKENDHVSGVMAEIESETSHSSEVQGIEESNSLVLQSPKIFFTKSEKRLQ